MKDTEGERYRRIQMFFDAAHELPPGERDRWLEASCDDAGIRAEVRSLLEFDGRSRFSEDAIERMRRDREAALDALVSDEAVHPEGAGSATAAGPAPIWMPERVGAYTLLSVLGRGGMGVVYEAQQENPHRRVALKLVHPMLADAEARQRLQREANILARLQHPGIAQVFEAGSDDLGHGEQPYFVMELVDGIDLRTHAERQGLDTRSRLALLARVADAVHHAHEHGVVHRDLKPDNILVDAEGQPKVLDFGVAQASDATALITSMTTASGALMGTLAYMAPEQLDSRIGPVGPWSDVYALGVVAFELLAGRRPHDVAGLSLSGAVNAIAGGEVPSLRRVARDAPADAETIVGAALAPEIPRRYPSAAALADDIRRFLGDRPLSARPPSRVDRGVRFVRRNRALVGGIAATILALLVGALVALDFALEEQAQRREASRRAWRAHVALASEALQRGDQRAALLHVDAARRSEHAGWEVDLLAAATSTHDLRLPAPAAILGDAPLRRGAIALADDDRVAAAPLADGSLIAWDLELGDELARLSEGGPFTLVAGQMPGGSVFAASADGRVVRWNPTTGDVRSLARWADEPWFLESLDVSADGRRVVVAGRDLVLVDDGEIVVLGTGPADAIRFTDVALAADGSSLVAFEGRGWVNQLVRFDLDRRERITEASTDDVALVSDPDLGTLLTLRQTHLNELAPDTLEPRAPPASFPVEHVGAEVWSLAVSSDGRLAASATETDVCLWDVADRALLLRWSHRPLGDEPLRAIRFTHDGRALLGAKGDALCLWNLDTLGRPLAPALTVDAPEYAYDAGLSADGTLLATCGRQGPDPLRLTDTRTGEELTSLPTRLRLTDWLPFPLVLSPDGTRMLCSISPQRALVLDLAAGRFEDHLLASDAPTASWPHVVRKIDRQGARLDIFRDSAPDGSWFASLQPDALTLVSGQPQSDAITLTRSSDGTTYALPLGDEPARSVALRPGAAQLAVGLTSGGVQVLDRRTGALLDRFDAAHGSSAWGVDYSPDGRRLASTGNDGRVLIWDADDLSSGPLMGLVGIQGSYTFLARWSEDGTRLLATTGGGTVVLWDSVPRSERRRQAAADERRRQGLRAELERRRALVGQRPALARELRADPALDPQQRDDLLRLMVEQGLPHQQLLEVQLTADERPAEDWLGEAAAELAADRISGGRDLLDQVPADARDWAWRHLRSRSSTAPRRGVIATGVVEAQGGESLIVMRRTAVELVDPESAERRPFFPSPGGHIWRLTARGNYAAVTLGPEDHPSLAVLDAASGRLAWRHPHLATYPEVSPVEALAVDNDTRNRAVCFDADGLRWTHAFADAGLGYARFTPDGSRLLLQEVVDGGLRIDFLDALTGERLGPSALFPGTLLGALDMAPDGDAVYLASPLGPLLELDPADLSVRRSLGDHGPASMGALPLSADGSRLALPTRTDGLFVLDRRTGDTLLHVDPGFVAYWSRSLLALTRDGSRLTCLTDLGAVSVAVDSRQPLLLPSTEVTLTAAGASPLRHPSEDLAVVRSKSGAAAEGSDAGPWLVRASDGTRLFPLDEAPEEVAAWGWSRDGSRLVMRTADGRLLCWHDGGGGTPQPGREPRPAAER